MKELIAIQGALNAPKTLFNSFGNYKYRACEGILEALKPLLKQHNCYLVLTDEMKECGGRVYVEAMASIHNAQGLFVNATACAREAEVKKGMDTAQITGSASSYARKYALNGLFCIDDAKDPDSTNKHGKEPSKEDVPW